MGQSVRERSQKTWADIVSRRQRAAHVWETKNNMVHAWRALPDNEQQEFRVNYPWLATVLDDFTLFDPQQVQISNSQVS